MNSTPQKVRAVALVLGMISVACSKATTGRTTAGTWRPFRGIEIQVPDGANVQESDGVLPGPGGLGGIPSGVRPTMDVSLSGPRAFYLQIVKPQAPETLEGEVGALKNNRAGSVFLSKTTVDGWELTYEMGPSPGVDGGTSTGKAHVIYREVAGSHYKCSWADSNCAAPAEAEAVCRSIRVKR